MVVVGNANMPPIVDINDDLARETSFYERALASAEVAVSKLKALGVSVRRPDDFYAEMVKSDEHMKRVRAELIFEQTSMETKDERRKAREQKRYGKQVQAEKLKERTLQKKDSIKSLDKWRKQRKRDGFEDNGAAPEGFEDEKRKKSGGGGSTGGQPRKPGRRRTSRRTSLDLAGGKGCVFFLICVWFFHPDGVSVEHLVTRNPTCFCFPDPKMPKTLQPATRHRRVRGVLPACPDT